MMKLCPLFLILFATSVVAGPQQNKAPINQRVESFKMRDARGAERSLQEFADQKLVVLVFVGCECPVAKLYGPRLAELAKQLEPKGVAFIGVNSNQQDLPSEIAHWAKLAGISFPILKDPNNVLADKLGAVRTPEVFLLDADRKVRYWGRIDDQYGVGFTRPKPGRRDLSMAIEELLAGKDVSQPVTEAPGCFIGRVHLTAKKGEVTYNKHVAGILNRRCVECHRPGQIGPFSLTSYEEALGWTDTIEEVIRERRMPPWHADPRYGSFSNDCRLTDNEMQLIFDWIKGGAPQGDPKDLPAPPKFADTWRIPKPDVVISVPKPFKVPAAGTVPYQFFLVETGFTEDKWVKAAEVRPSNRAVVHHVLIFVQPAGGYPPERRLGFASNWLAATVPGARPMILPDGMAKFVPAGAKLLFQIHYTPNGAPQEDQTSVALSFADPRTVRREVQTEMVANNKFQIPPGAASHTVEATRVLPEDMLVMTYMPHTHLRGRAFRYEAQFPDGKQEILMDLPRYDFNWQNSYVLSEPRVFPKGTTIRCVAVYDNSSANRSNPNPNATVKWGDQTWEEMMIGYLDLTPVNQDLLKNPKPATKLIGRDWPKLDPELQKLAERAFDSQETFDAFAAAVHKQAPQVDRLCLTFFKGDSLRVERAAHPGSVKAQQFNSGFEQMAFLFMLPAYGLMGRVVENPDLKQAAARAVDLKMMSNSFGSSLHVPVAFEGRPATVNFWSKDSKAFPKEKQAFLQAIAEAMNRKS